MDPQLKDFEKLVFSNAILCMSHVHEPTSESAIVSTVSREIALEFQ